MLPHALVMGVDYNMFWTLNPKTITPFIRAFSLKKEEEDRTLWTQGKYIQLAVASVLDKNTNYPTRSFSEQGKIEVDPDLKMKELRGKFTKRMVDVNKNFRGRDAKQ